MVSNISEVVALEAFAESFGGSVVVSVELSEARLAYEAAAQRLRDALVRKAAMKGRVEKMERARGAAQEDAAGARQKWSNLLRESDGVLTREVQKLRATERGSLNLMEEYEAMQQEMAAPLASLELEVAALADLNMTSHNRVVRQAAQDAFTALMERMGSFITTAYLLSKRAETAPLPSRNRPSEEALESDFLQSIRREIQSRADSVASLVTEAIGVSKLELEGVDMELVKSPARRSMLSRQVDAQSKLSVGG